MITNRGFTILAGQSESIPINGNFVRCLASQGQVLRVRTEKDGAGSSFEMEAGLGFSTRPFTNVRIDNPSDQSVDVKFVFSDEGHISDNRLVGNLDLNGSIKVLSTMPQFTDYTQLVASGSWEVLAPERESRRSLLIVPVDGEITLKNGYKTSNPYEWGSWEQVTFSAVAGTKVDVFEDYD